MSLSSLIVQREVASIRQVEEALARQVLYGGDLVTNLLEVVQLPEAILVPLLAESVGIPHAPIGPLPTPSAEAQSLVPEDVATRRLVVPLSLDGDRLVLAVSEPLGPDVVDELSFALGKQIIERIAPAVRIREALARVYGVPLERRMGRLVGRLAGIDPTVPNSLPPLLSSKPYVPPLPRAPSDTPPALVPPGTPALGALRMPEDTTLASEHPEPPSLAAVDAEPAHEAPLRPPRVPDQGSFIQGLQREGKAEGVRRRRGPLTLQAATSEVASATDRDALLQLFFDFARQFFEYSALFVVHGDIAEGRDASGNGASRDRVLALGVPLDHASILATARERAVPLCVVPSTAGLDAVLVGDLRRSPGTEVLVVPIVVRGRSVALFVADDGGEGINPTAQGEVATLAVLVGREFERLIVRIKLQGFSGDKSAESRRVVDPRRVGSKRPRRAPPTDDDVSSAVQEAPPPVAELAPPVAEIPREVPGVAEIPVPPGEPLAPEEGAPAVDDEITEKPPVVEPTPVLQLEPETSPSPPQAGPVSPRQGEVPRIPTPLATLPGPIAELAPAPAAVVSMFTESSVAEELPPEDGWAAADDGARPGALRPDTVLGVIDLRPRHKTLQSFPSPRLEEAPANPPPAHSDEQGQEPGQDRRDAHADGHPDEHAEDEEPEFADEPGAPLSEDHIPSEPRALSDRPPPPQTAAVRRPSGKPIPREDPDEGHGTRARHIDFTSDHPPPVVDDKSGRLLREIDALAEKFVQEVAPISRAPVSGQSVAVPPHRPPSSRSHQPLPSVIVDVESEYDQLAQRFVDNPADEQIEAELLRLGQHAMPSIMKQFPGPLTVGRDSFEEGWPRVTECGPVLRLVAGQRRVALPFVLARTEDSDPEPRFWATYLLTELAYADAVPAVVARLFDDSKRTRRAARLAAQALAVTAGGPLVAELDRIVTDPNATTARRVSTIDTLGEMRDPLVAPILLSALADVDEDVALAARRALVLVTRQDFGRDTRKWLTWWGTSSSRHRIEWLIDALTHETPAIRRAAGQELKALTEEYFGYYDDLPKKERDRAQQRYRDWWKTEGQARYRRP